MLLPTGTIRALRKNTDAIAFVVMVFLLLAALAKGAPAFWTSIIALLAFAFYNQRRSATEAHARALAEQQVLLAATKAEAIRARHVDLLSQEQERLPLNLDRDRTPRRRR